MENMIRTTFDYRAVTTAETEMGSGWAYLCILKRCTLFCGLF